MISKNKKERLKYKQGTCRRTLEKSTMEKALRKLLLEDYTVLFVLLLLAS